MPFRRLKTSSWSILVADVHGDVSLVKSNTADWFPAAKYLVRRKKTGNSWAYLESIRFDSDVIYKARDVILVRTCSERTYVHGDNLS